MAVYDGFPDRWIFLIIEKAFITRGYNYGATKMLEKTRRSHIEQTWRRVLMEPRVSIVVPVYKAEDWLCRCLKSIVDQSLKSIQVILVDDGSPDRSGLICDEFAQRDDRVVVIHGKNTGPGGARRLGLSQARGEYVGFVDADDYIEGNMFETLYATAQQHNVDIVNCGHFSEWPGRTKPVTSGLEKNRILRHEDVERYHKDFSNYLEPFWFPWRNIYRREFLCENQITFGEEGVGGDTNFNLRAFFLADSIYALDLPLYHYVQNPLSITLARFRDALLDDLMFTYERRLEIYEMFVSRKEAKVGLSRYVVEKYIPRLLMNAWHSPRHDFLQRIKAISTDQRIQEALHLYQPSGKLDPVLDVVMRLLKRRMYRTTWLVLGARFGTQSS